MIILIYVKIQHSHFNFEETTNGREPSQPVQKYALHT